MEIPIITLDGTKKGKIVFPFTETLRRDIIRRAVAVFESNNRQPYGADPEAGMRASATLSRRRRDYRGSYGHGISRVPRKILSRRGTRMNWVAAVAPGTVGGRRAHAPKAEKQFTKQINAKENRLAIRSALVASLTREQVLSRGHPVPETYPFILDDAVEKLSKTKEVLAALITLGFNQEIKRTSVMKIRAGKGKARGRRKQTKVGALIVTAGASPLGSAIENILGFSCVPVTHLNAALLAPGGEPGRPIIFTEGAIKRLDAEKLYTEERVKTSSSKTEKSKGMQSSTAKKATKTGTSKDDQKVLKNSATQSKQESPAVSSEKVQEKGNSGKNTPSQSSNDKKTTQGVEA